MRYICIRTYGNGYYQNKIFPQIFRTLEYAERKCKELNAKDRDDGAEKWIPFPMYVED